MFNKAIIKKNDNGHSMKWNVQLYKEVNSKLYYCGIGRFCHTLEKAVIYAQKNAQIWEIIED